jgi:hypothetical protein
MSDTNETRTSAYPIGNEIAEAYLDETRVIWIMSGKVRTSDPTHWFKAYLVRYDNLTNDASYTTDGVWYTLVKSGNWTADKSGLGADEAEDEDEETQPVEEWIAYQQFNKYLDEVYAPVQVANISFNASRVLRELDWTAYRESFLNYIDFMEISVIDY